METILRIGTKVLVWGLIASIIFMLRSFFLLVFLTFLFAFIQTRGIRALEPYIKFRTLRVSIVGVFFLSVIVVLGLFIIPQVGQQAEIFLQRLPSYIRTLDGELIKLRQTYPSISAVLPDQTEIHTNDTGEAVQWDAKSSPTTYALQKIFGFEGASEARSSFTRAVGAASNIGAKVLGTISAFLLSLLFSFLIVLDLPSLTRSVLSLKNTKLRFVYDEVAHQIYHFGSTLGRAFEAQFYIALLNTFLTALGIYFLGIWQHVAFLSMVVFLCSFIPVAGVFISSIPICLLSLQHSGLNGLLLGVALITIIHMVEAYILNPKIYGRHLRINPVIVLIILTISGKIFGAWGLILGVPFCTYIFSHAIRLENSARAA